jgi:hypothetical protein
MGLNTTFQFAGPVEQLEQARERAHRRRVPLAVVLREAVELYLDCDEEEIRKYFSSGPGARRVRAEIVGAPLRKDGRE